MMRNLLPDSYKGIPEEELILRIKKKKEEYGKRIVILGHHYQRVEIVQLSDFRGDSFGLSRMASQQQEAEFIVFCGVNFMAESAEILSRPSQKVLHADPYAGCPLAAMADIEEVSRAWDVIADTCGTDGVIPVTYMNSEAELKAFCGRNGGVVCTSSNASAVFDWGFEKGGKVLFFPDEHLGRNTARKKGIPEGETILWDPKKDFGGNAEEDIKNAKVILWKGYCHVHTKFTPQDVRDARARFPEATVVVHPECVREVMDLADYSGSTGFIVRFVEEAQSGSTIVIGTEINLVSRLARENPDKRVLPLARSLCPNMYKVSLNDLLWTLDSLGSVNVVTVPEETKEQAKVALDRMLKIV